MHASQRSLQRSCRCHTAQCFEKICDNCVQETAADTEERVDTVSPVGKHDIVF